MHVPWPTWPSDPVFAPFQVPPPLCTPTHQDDTTRFAWTAGGRGAALQSPPTLGSMAGSYYWDAAGRAMHVLLKGNAAVDVREALPVRG